MATIGQRIVMFGGCTGLLFPLSDTWVWDATSWTAQDVTGPSARDSAVMATLGNEVLVFGGADANWNPLGDTWVWDGTSWSQKNVSGPGARYGASMGTLGSLVVLFGGSDYDTSYQGLDLDDTWVWDGSSWTRLNVTGPSARDSAAMAFDPELTSAAPAASLREEWPVGHEDLQVQRHDAHDNAEDTENDRRQIHLRRRTG